MSEHTPPPGMDQMLPAAAIVASFVEALQAVGFERSHAVTLAAAFFTGTASAVMPGRGGES